MRFLRVSILLFVVGCGSVKEKTDAGTTQDTGSGSNCAATEDCFNGVDDDCNEQVDCADTACTGGATPLAQCVADPAGAPVGTVETGACSGAFATATPLFSGLVPGTCGAGSCGCNPTPIGGARCDATLVQHPGGGLLACTTAGTTIWTRSNADGCFGFTALGTAYYTLSQNLVLACAPPTGGTATKNAPTWQTTNNFCAAAGAGGGCAAGQVCMPAAPKHCVLEQGNLTTCTRPGYNVLDATPYFTGFDDSARTCSCACNKIGTCPPVQFGVGACTTNTANGCRNTFSTLNSAQIPNPVGAGCGADATEAGATATDSFQRTVCCTN